MPKTSSSLSGGCRCGAVRIQLARQPIVTHCCHCRDCQRTTGSAFCVNTMIETEHLRVTRGKPERYAGEGSHPAFRCPTCNLTLWSHHPKLGDGIVFVAVGVLDAGERLAPEAHYFIRSKHPWVTLPSDVPAFEGFGYPQNEAARKRIEAVLGAGPGPR